MVKIVVNNLEMETERPRGEENLRDLPISYQNGYNHGYHDAIDSVRDLLAEDVKRSLKKTGQSSGID